MRSSATTAAAEHALLDDRPARDWLEAFPLGNGRQGVMVFGGVEQQRFGLNDTFGWSGSPASERREDPDPAATARTLAEVRAALTAGDHAAAQRLAQGLQHRQSQSFVPLGELTLQVAPHGESSGYRRSLDLATAVHEEHYTVADGKVGWTAYATADPPVLVVELRTDVPAGLNLTASLSSPMAVLATDLGRGSIAVRLRLPSDVYPPHDLHEIEWDSDPALAGRAAIAARWIHDGAEDDGSDGRLRVRGVHRLRLLLTTGTTATAVGTAPAGDDVSVMREAQDRLTLAAAVDPDALATRHREAHAALFGRVGLRFGREDRVDAITRDRLAAANDDERGVLAGDPGLAALLFHYGRYLLICSSRAGGAPANLQGIWNDQLPPPWSSNFTVNINLQMNYWAAEPADLLACLPPLFSLIELMQRTGAETARRYYGAAGWAAHHNADVWGYSRPVGHGRAQPRWALWPMAACWLVAHLWTHLEFAAPGSERDAFARNAAWPALRGASEFALDWLVELPDGSLGTMPSTSPENGFLIGDEAYEVGVCSTMDLSLVRDCFNQLAALAAELGVEQDPVVEGAAAALPRIHGVTSGRDGLIREWRADHPQSEPHHRHVSHLYFFYPGTGPVDAALTRAVSASLDDRGDESTGWSLAWKIALRARLRQPDRVAALLRLVFRAITVDEQHGQRGGLYPNLLASHPPYQIDGNLGYVAGVVEALLQSHRGEIELLPAVPAELGDGEATGLRARGGVTVGVRWTDGRLTGAELESPVGQTVRVRAGTIVASVVLPAGEVVALGAPFVG